MPERAVQIIGVPIDLGANMRGANMAPSAVRIAELHHKIRVLGYDIFDIGDLEVPIRDTLGAEVAQAKYRPQIQKVCSNLAEQVYQAMHAERVPIVLGGDHCIAMGTVAGVSRYFKDKGEQLGLVWIDAHADLNTPQSSVTGNIHGMPLSVLIGNGHQDLLSIGGFSPKLRPENIALIGIRMLDGAEKDICRQSGIRYFTMREIDERGMAAVMKDALAVAGRGTSGIHLSFDLDGVDPMYAPGVSTPVTGGLSYREAHLALEMLAESGLLRSMEFVEMNPMTDTMHKTAQLTVELIQSALGKSIV